jgi:hypothetical protein
MQHHHSAASSILDTPYFDVPRGDLRAIPFSRVWTPEQRLMAAVVDDAIRSWRRSATLPGRRAARLWTELHDWLTSDATDWPFSFANACAHLELTPDLIRARLGLSHATDEAA